MSATPRTKQNLPNAPTEETKAMSVSRSEYLPRQRPAASATTSDDNALLEQYYQELVRVQGTEKVVFGGGKRRFNPDLAKQSPLMVQLGSEVAQGGVPPALAATSVGRITLNTGSITFDDGVPVGGWANFGIFPDGSWNFSGHFHDSGFVGFNATIVVGITLADTMFYFPKQAAVGGTISSTPRDFDWNDSSPQPNLALANAMRAQTTDYQWSWYAATSFSLAELVSDLTAIIGTGAAVVALL
jgi:hypothetical protein